MSRASPLASGAETRLPNRILCVDDEPNILSSLHRLFRSHGYQVFTAQSAKAGLELLETEPMDLVISDMRMPEMNGARFLECVRARWPDTLRLILTGHADIQSILVAINSGEIYRYITKPWDDNDILLVVRHALERKALLEEKQRLEGLTRTQNEELKTLNASLEARVESRTEELRKTRDDLIVSNERLKANFLTSIKVFSNLIQTRDHKLAGHSRRVADLARRIAVKLELSDTERQEIFIGGLLHNIGKIGFPDELLAMPVTLLKADNLGLYCKYPVRGEQLLMPLEDLRGAAGIVRSHQERFDGKGFPDRLSGFNIPIGARVLAVACDYYNLQNGTLAQRRLRPEEAAKLISQERGKRYDPAVVDAFLGAETGSNIAGATESIQEEAVSAAELRPGMITSRDLITRDGFLLLSADYVLSERLIQQIRDFEVTSGSPVIVYVRPQQR